MEFVPKSLITLGARLLSARAAARLRREVNAEAVQAAAFEMLVPPLAASSFWAHEGIEGRMSQAKFQECVPLRTYEDLAPCIQRMMKGEPDVLWPGLCQLYAVSSGTTAGPTKHLPVTAEMLEHFKRAGLNSLLWYTGRAGNAHVFRGRHLILGGSTGLARIPESGSFEAYAADLSGIAALHLPRWMERHYYEPGPAIAQIADWPQKIEAIVKRTATADITLIAGIPSWILVLAEALRSGAPGSPKRLQDLWPNLECLTHGGVPVAPFQEELHTVLGPNVKFHEVYPASEAFIAAQDADPGAGLRLMADVGVFFEFLPMSEFSESALPRSGAKAVPLSGVRTGVDYALVLTTPAGLARYVIGDVVRFASTEPPRIFYVGRTKLQLSAFGEHVIEKEVTDALLAVCRRNGWTIVNFHVAPLFANSTTGRVRGRHEWWVELKAGTHLTPTGPIMAVELDAELRKLNDDYAAKRNGGGLEAPYVRLVQPGVFEKWMRHQGKWGGQNKMARCRSDRVIADELGQALHFAED